MAFNELICKALSKHCALDSAQMWGSRPKNSILRYILESHYVSKLLVAYFAGYHGSMT